MKSIVPLITFISYTAAQTKLNEVCGTGIASCEDQLCCGVAKSCYQNTICDINIEKKLCNYKTY